MLTREQLAANAARTADYVRRRRVIGDHDRRRAVPRARYPELIESDYAARLVAILDDQRAQLQELLAELPRLVANTAREDEGEAPNTVTIAGLRVAIEHRSGDLRNGHMMLYDYGSLPGLVGADGEDVDVFIGPEPHPSEVYVVHQQRKGTWEEYDEDKTMLGWSSADTAKQAYLAQYGDERFFGGMTVFPVDAFVTRLRARGYVSYPEQGEKTETITVGTLAFREDVGEGKRVYALLDRVRDGGASAARRAEAAAQAIAPRVSDHGRRELDRQTTAGLGVAVPTVDAAIPAIVEGFIAENVSLVRRLAARQLDDLERVIQRAFVAGTPWQTLAREIEARFQIAERHARLIARDQISKLNAQFARARHQELGLVTFRWYAIQDTRTRPSHAAKHGKLWAYVDGYGVPVPRFFPGEEVCCRCGELPAFDNVLALVEPSKLPRRAGDITDEDEVRTIPARMLAERGYYEPSMGLDLVKLGKAHEAIRQGQRDPVRIVVGRNGRYELVDGRHRLRAAIAQDRPVKVQFEKGGDLTGTGPDLVFRSQRKSSAPARSSVL